MRRLPNGRLEVEVFVSWSHEDASLKEDLSSRLRPRLNNLSDVSFTLFEDRQIELGEDWDKRLKSQLEKCDFVMPLISHSFLSSRYIGDVELPFVTGPDARKPPLPVALGAVPMEGSFTLRGLEVFQIFRLDERAYSELGRPVLKDRFATELAQAMQRRALGAEGRS